MHARDLKKNLSGGPVWLESSPVPARARYTQRLYNSSSGWLARLAACLRCVSVRLFNSLSLSPIPVRFLGSSFPSWMFFFVTFFLFSIDFRGQLRHVVRALLLIF